MPRDHGAHPAFRTEWWYATALVNDPDGRRYGFQITFFRHGLDPSPPRPGQSLLRARQVMAAHLAVADIPAQRFVSAQRLRRVAAGLAGFSTEQLAVWTDDWEMTRDPDGTLAVVAADLDADVSLRVRMTPTRPLVLHGDGGYSRKGDDPANASVYLTWPRLVVSGDLVIGGRSTTVEGTAWFDHEWGTSQLGPGVVGWDWFSLRLDDGRDLMVYHLRRAGSTASPWSSGTLVTADGGTVRLGLDDVELEVTALWTSDEGSVYPARWLLRVPTHGLDLEIRPLLADAEVEGGHSTGVTYWEGPVSATGSTTGEGYVELTGYAGSLEGRF